MTRTPHTRPIRRPRTWFFRVLDRLTHPPYPRSYDNRPPRAHYWRF